MNEYRLRIFNRQGYAAVTDPIPTLREARQEARANLSESGITRPPYVAFVQIEKDGAILETAYRVYNMRANRTRILFQTPEEYVPQV